jgi:hypothetical protein
LLRNSRSLFVAPCLFQKLNATCRNHYNRIEVLPQYSFTLNSRILTAEYAETTENFYSCSLCLRVRCLPHRTFDRLSDRISSSAPSALSAVFLLLPSLKPSLASKKQFSIQKSSPFTFSLLLSKRSSEFYSGAPYKREAVTS